MTLRKDCAWSVLEAADRPVRTGGMNKRSGLYELAAPGLPFALYLAADRKPLKVLGRAVGSVLHFQTLRGSEHFLISPRGNREGRVCSVNYSQEVTTPLRCRERVGSSLLHSAPPPMSGVCVVLPYPRWETSCWHYFSGDTF